MFRTKGFRIGAAAALALLLTAVLFPAFSRADSTNVSDETQLRDALADAGCDTIFLTKDIVLASEQLRINRAVTIRGNGHTIRVPRPGVLDSGLVDSDASSFRAILIESSGSGSVVLEDLGIKGGKGANTGDYGGGVSIASGADVVFRRVTLTNSGGTAPAGGILNDGTLHIYDSAINRNAGSYGGGFLNRGTMVIERTSFSENRSTSEGGGGGAGENQGNLYINNCTFANNKSSEIGGALNGIVQVVMNSTFTGNVTYSTYYQCGAIRTPMAVVNCLFAYNYARDSAGSVYNLNDYMDTYYAQSVNSVFHAEAQTGVQNRLYPGAKDGSDDTLFPGGIQAYVTNERGAQQGTESIYQPLLLTPPGQYTAVVPIRAGAALPTPIRSVFDPDNEYFAYYNETEQTWYHWTGYAWTAGSAPTSQQLAMEVTTDPFGTPLTAVGGSSGQQSALYAVKLLETGNWLGYGSVRGATIYGESYSTGASVIVAASAASGYRFDHWVVQTGSAAEVQQTANPVTLSVGTENITLYPVFAASGTTGTDLRLTLSPESIDISTGTWSASAVLRDTVSAAALAAKPIVLYGQDTSGRILFSQTVSTEADGTAHFSGIATPAAAGEYTIHANFAGDAAYQRAEDSETLTVTAVTHTLTLNRAGGSGGPDKLYLKYGDGFYADQNASSRQRITATANGITLPVHGNDRFDGYYTEADGAGTQIIDARGYLASGVTNTQIAADITLYAAWTLRTPMPSVAPASVTKAAQTQEQAAFTLQNSAAYAGSTVWTVYEAGTGTEQPSGVTLLVSGSALTLSKTGGLPEDIYYVAAAEPGKLESDRVPLTVQEKTPTPTTDTPTLDKVQAEQYSVAFPLTNDPPFAADVTWTLYANATGTALASGVGISYNSTDKTLALRDTVSYTDVPDGTYYVSASAPGRGESDRLALTVHTPANPSNVAINGVMLPKGGTYTPPAPGSGSASLDPTGKILTLHSLRVTAASVFTRLPNNAVIYLGDEVELVLKGNSSVKAADSTARESIGLYTTHNLRIRGDGSLTAASGASGFTVGLYVGGDLSVDGRVAGVGGAGVQSGSSFGVYADTLTVTGTLTGSGGPVTSRYADSVGVYSGDTDVSGRMYVTGRTSALMTGNLTVHGQEIAGDPNPDVAAADLILPVHYDGFDIYMGTSGRTGGIAKSLRIGVFSSDAAQAEADVPETGDGSAPWIFAAAALTAAVGLLVPKRRRAQRRG